MDDTVAMQDNNGPMLYAPISKGDACDSTVGSEQPLVQPAAASQEGSRPECSPCAPQSPSMITQQVLLLAVGLASAARPTGVVALLRACGASLLFVEEACRAMCGWVGRQQ